MLSFINSKGVFLVAQMVKNPPVMWETWVPSLGWEGPLEKGKATLSQNLVWRIPWTSWGRKESDPTEQLSLHLGGKTHSWEPHLEANSKWKINVATLQSFFPRRQDKSSGWLNQREAYFNPVSPNWKVSSALAHPLSRVTPPHPPTV